MMPVKPAERFDDATCPRVAGAAWRQLAVGLWIIAALSALATFMAVRGYADKRDGAVQGVAAHAAEAAVIAESFLTGEIQTLQAVAAAPRVVTGDVAGMREYFARADPVGAAAGGGFAWIDRQGLLQVLVAVPASSPPADLSGRPYVRETLSSGRPYVSDVFVSAGVVPVVVVAVPSFDAGGAVNGLVIRTHRLDVDNRLSRLLAAIDNVALIDRSGGLIVHDGPVSSGVVTPTPTHVELGELGVATVDSPDGRRVVATGPVREAGWTVAVDRAASTVYGDLRGDLTRQLAGIALTTAVAVVALITFIRRSRRQIVLNAALEESQRRAVSLQTITAALASAVTPDDVGAVVTNEVAAALDADAVNVGVVDADRNHVVWVGMIGYSEAAQRDFLSIPLTMRTAVTDVIATGAPVAVNSPAEFIGRYPHLTSYVAEEGPDCSWLHWPLFDQGSCVGQLGLMWRHPRPISDDDRRYIATIAALVGRSTSRAQAAERDRAAVDALQHATLGTLPTIDGLSLTSDYQPAATTKVGGDWYDALILPKGGVYLCVGDVVGHGLTAVEDMVQLRNAARAFAIAGHQPQQILAELDHFCAAATHGQYATVAVAILHPLRDRVTYATAGHPPPLLREADGLVLRLDDAHGPPIGATNGGGYRQHTSPVALHDTLVLYTDGVVESRTRTIDDGVDCLADALADSDPNQPRLARRLITACATATSDSQRDDRCLITVNRRR